MKYPTLTIGDDNASPLSRRNRHRKTRAFSMTLLRAVTWTSLNKTAKPGYLRPAFLDICGTESEHRAFIANLREGRPAKLSDREAFELLRSEPYCYAPPQRCEAGIRQIIYLPDLFDVETKSMRDPLQVIVMPPSIMLATVGDDELRAVQQVYALTRKRHADEIAKLEAENATKEYWRRRTVPGFVEVDDATLRYWALIARELTVRLDARTTYPIPTEPEFRALLVQWLVVAGHLRMGNGCALWPISGRRDDSYRPDLRVDAPSPGWNQRDDVGYVVPVALSMSQAELGAALADLARLYYS